jgi:hypothetical protein
MTSPEFGTLWVYRQLKNWLDVYRWGLENQWGLMFVPSSLHVTVATIRHSTDISGLGDLDPEDLIIENGKREILRLGKNGAQCLGFESASLVERHRDIASRLPIDHGDQGLMPHLTLCRHRQQVFEPQEAYQGPLIFGPEIQGEFKANFRVKQRSVDANDIRALLGLKPHENRSQNSNSYSEEALEKRERQRKQKRIREDLEDSFGDDPWIRGQVSKRL